MRCETFEDPDKREAMSEKVRLSLANQDEYISDMRRDLARAELPLVDLKLRRIDRELNLCLFRIAVPGRWGSPERRCAPRRRSGSASRCRSPGRLGDDQDSDPEHLAPPPPGVGA